MSRYARLRRREVVTVAWVTAIGPSMEQVEYRLTGASGCADGTDAAKVAAALGLTSPGMPTSNPGAPHVGQDAAIDYRLAGAERPLRWWGKGLREFGIEPGTWFAETDYDRARRLMDWRDPNTGVRLVEPKVAIDPAAMLPAAPMLRAIRVHIALADTRNDGLSGAELDAYLARHAERLDTAATARLGSKRARDRYATMTRQIARRGELHTVPAHELGNLADVFGIDVTDVYGQAYETALRTGYELREQQSQGRTVRRLLPKRIVVGNRGFDFTTTFPKSDSLMLALADQQFADEYEKLLDQNVHEGAALLEEWSAYAMRGHHGGRDANGGAVAAERIETSGMSGWVTVHRAARPVEGAPIGDPHWHAHFTISAVVRGEDGNWSTTAAGGRDLYRHAKAVDAFIQARHRHDAHTRYGITFTKNERGVWEISGMPEATIRLFSKRDAQIRELFARLNLSYDAASMRARKTASAKTREAKTTEQLDATDDMLRAWWQAEARAAGHDPAAITTRILHPADDTETDDEMPSVEEIAAIVFDPIDGLTAHDKRFTYPQAYAAILDTVPTGIPSREAADELVDQVMTYAGFAVELRADGPQHFTHPQKYTTQDVIAAEATILRHAHTHLNRATARLDERTARRALAGFEARRGLQLSAEQRAVYMRIVSGGHGIDAVIGVAGSGKTTIMAAVRTAFETAGYTVAGTSTAAVAVENLRRAAGLEHSRTIASYTTSVRQQQRGLHGIDVLIVDEAAMADERDMALLLTHAAVTGTDIVGIGDPRQLHSPGIGGSFEIVHKLVGGEVLRENRRQQHPIERSAVELLRRADRLPALRMLADAGRVHATRTRDDAMAALVADWSRTALQYADPHELIDHTLILAALNSQVDALNLAARQMRAEAGHLGTDDIVFALPGDEQLRLAVGDVVAVRRNDYRSHDDPTQHDVLNGYRGVVVAIDHYARTVDVQWREQVSGGPPQLRHETITAKFIAGGGLSYGIAITGHRGQGLTTGQNFTLGDDIRAGALYQHLTRGRHANHVYLSLEAYADDTTRARIGPVNSAEELGARVVELFVADLAHDQDEDLILPNLRQNLRALLGPDVLAGLDERELREYLSRDAQHDPAADIAQDDDRGDQSGDEPDVTEILTVLLGEHTARRAQVDPAWPALRTRLYAAAAAGEDLPALLGGILRDPALPSLDQARSVAKVLAWRLDRARPSAVLVHETIEQDTLTEADIATVLDDLLASADPHVRSDDNRWEHLLLSLIGDDDQHHVLADQPDDQLATAVTHADQAARDAAAILRTAATHEAALAASVRAGTGPATRRQSAYYARFATRGNALDDMRQLAQHVTPLRTELDTLTAQLSAASGTAEEAAFRARMAELRAELTDATTRWMTLDQLAGSPTGRDQLLERWHHVQRHHPTQLARARDADQRALERASRTTAQARAAAQDAAARLRATLDVYLNRTAATRVHPDTIAAGMSPHERPHGLLPDRELATRLTSALRRTATTYAKADIISNDADRLRREALSGSGPATQAVTAAFQQIRVRAEALGELVDVDRQLGEARAGVQRMESELRTLTAMINATTRAGRHVLRGPERDTAARHTHQLRDELLMAYADIESLTVRAETLRIALPDATNADQLLDAWRRAQEAWPRDRQRAMAADLRAADGAASLAAERRDQATAAADEVTALQAETDHRASLSPDDADREKRERTRVVATDTQVSRASLDSEPEIDAEHDTDTDLDM